MSSRQTVMELQSLTKMCHTLVMTFWPVTHVVSSRVQALTLGGMPDPDVWPDGNQASSRTRRNAAFAILYRKMGSDQSPGTPTSQPQLKGCRICPDLAIQMEKVADGSLLITLGGMQVWPIIMPRNWRHIWPDITTQRHRSRRNTSADCHLVHIVLVNVSTLSVPAVTPSGVS